MAFKPDDTIQFKFRNVSFLCTEASKTGGRKLDIKSLIRTATVPQLNLDAPAIDKLSDSGLTFGNVVGGITTSVNTNTNIKTKKNLANQSFDPLYHFITQDIGVEVPKFNLTAIFYGDKYRETIDELTAALELGTPGELVYLGKKHTVLVDKFSESYVSTEFQYVKMNITFVLNIPEKPRKTKFDDVYANYLGTQAEKANAAWIKDSLAFENQAARYNSVIEKASLAKSIKQSAATVKQSMSKARRAADAINNTYEAAMEAIDEIFATSDELVNDLTALHDAINNFIDKIGTAFTSRVDTYLVLLDMSVQLGKKVLNIPGSTNEKLLNSFFRLGAILGIAKELGKFEFASVSEVKTVKDQIFTELDGIASDMAENVSFAGTYMNIVEVRAAAWKTLSAKIAALPNIITITINDPMPVEVLAYELYGDATRANEIIRRNNLPNSLFVQGAIQVLEN